MTRIVWLIFVWPSIVYCVIYIDSHILEFEKSIVNASINYTPDDKGNGIFNVTVQTFKTITKALLYFNVRMAADKNDRDYRFEAVKTVFDLGKFLTGAQSNSLLRGFIERFTQSSDFDFKFPKPPVRQSKMN